MHSSQERQDWILNTLSLVANTFVSVLLRKTLKTSTIWGQISNVGLTMTLSFYKVGHSLSWYNPAVSYSFECQGIAISCVLYLNTIEKKGISNVVTFFPFTTKNQCVYPEHVLVAHNSLEYMAMELLSISNNVPAKTPLIMFYKVIKNTLILFNVIFQCCDHQAFPLHLTYGGS